MKIHLISVLIIAFLSTSVLISQTTKSVDVKKEIKEKKTKVSDIKEADSKKLNTKKDCTNIEKTKKDCAKTCLDKKNKVDKIECEKKCLDKANKEAKNECSHKLESKITNTELTDDEHCVSETDADSKGCNKKDDCSKKTKKK